MSRPSSADREHPFADELALLAPELADSFDAALAELLATEATAASHPALAELLDTGESSVVVALPMAPRRRLGRRVALAGGATAVVMAATTGLAAASVLPSPVQQAVADVASRVGIELPRPAPIAPTVAPSTTVATTTAPAPAPPSAAPSLPPTTVPVTVPAPATEQASTPPAVAPPAQVTPPPGTAPAVPPAAPAGPPSSVPAAVPVEPGPPASTPAVTRPSTPGPPPETAPTPPTSVAPPGRPGASEGFSRFRAAVRDYLACLRDAGGNPALLATCVRPDPGDFGLPSWPFDPTGRRPRP